eukprot:338824_1
MTNVLNVKSSVVDDILNEIEAKENEKEDIINDILDQIESKQNKTKEKHINWDDVVLYLRTNNISAIKHLISSDIIDINSINPIDGCTLLIYASIKGNFDLVKLLCTFGGDVNIQDKSGNTALNYAQKLGYYSISELLFFQQMGGSMGQVLKNKAEAIHDKKEISKYAKICGFPEPTWNYEHGQPYLETNYVNFSVNKYIINCLKKRYPISDDIIMLQWQTNSNCLNTEWFKQMMNTYETILSNTTDKLGWDYLKKYYLTLTLWYLPHPQYEGRTLYYELYYRVRNEAKKQGVKLLQKKIQKLDDNLWKQLKEYDVNDKTKLILKARQDIIEMNGIKSEYKKNDLIKYPKSTHFNPIKHYDIEQYLNKLLFFANVIDKKFQQTVQNIIGIIGENNNINVSYRKGPVKTITRSKVKSENDYKEESYPTSSQLLDLNRCAIQFDKIDEMLLFLNKFEEIINSKQTDLKRIVRIKNGWSSYKHKT